MNKKHLLNEAICGKGTGYSKILKEYEYEAVGKAVLEMEKYLQDHMKELTDADLAEIEDKYEELAFGIFNFELKQRSYYSPGYGDTAPEGGELENVRVTDDDGLKEIIDSIDNPRLKDIFQKEYPKIVKYVYDNCEDWEED